MIGEDHLPLIEKGMVQEQRLYTPYFNVPALGKTLPIQTKNFLFDSTPSCRTEIVIDINPETEIKNNERNMDESKRITRFISN